MARAAEAEGVPQSGSSTDLGGLKTSALGGATAPLPQRPGQATHKPKAGPPIALDTALGYLVGTLAQFRPPADPAKFIKRLTTTPPKLDLFFSSSSSSSSHHQPCLPPLAFPFFALHIYTAPSQHAQWPQEPSKRPCAALWPANWLPLLSSSVLPTLLLAPLSAPPLPLLLVLLLLFLLSRFVASRRLTLLAPRRMSMVSAFPLAPDPQTSAIGSWG